MKHIEHFDQICNTKIDAFKSKGKRYAYSDQSKWKEQLKSRNGACLMYHCQPNQPKCSIWERNKEQ